MMYGVLDIAGTNRFYVFRDDEEISPKQLYDDSIKIPSLLVCPPKGTNKDYYLLNPDDPVVEDIVSIKEENGRRSYSLKYNAIISSTKMILSLYNKIDEIPNNYKCKYKAKLSISEGNSQTEFDGYFHIWARKVREYLSVMENCNKIFIPVPDNIPAAVQDSIINNFGGPEKVFLLWNSVAAALGFYEDLKLLNENDNVLIADQNNLSEVYSIITMKMCDKDGRVIPGHHVYYDADSFDQVNPKPLNRVSLRDNEYSSYFADDGLLPVREEAGRIFKVEDLETIFDKKEETRLSLQNKNIKCIIVLGKIDTAKVFNNQAIPIKNHKRRSRVAYGCYQYVKMKNQGLIPYYDECDALSLVVFNKKDERFDFKTLIQHNDKLEGGERIKGSMVDGIKLPAGKDPDVKFLLRLGEKKNVGKLKELIQKINYPDDFDYNHNKVELELYPSLIPGQGQADVIIKAKVPYSDLLNNLKLNWRSMRNSNDTVASLEAKMERTFPPAYEACKWDKDKFDSFHPFIHLFNTGCTRNINIVLAQKNSYPINNSYWPYKDLKTINRFLRVNTFSKDILSSPAFNDKNYGDVYLSDADKEEIKLFFKSLEQAALKYRDDSEIFESLLSIIAWTYAPEEFSEVKELVIRKFIINKTGRAQYYSFLGNMLCSNNDVAWFIDFFVQKVNTTDYNQGWNRAGYELFSKCNFFFDDDKNRIYKHDFENVVRKVLNYIRWGLPSSSQRNLALKFLTFCLKFRKLDPSFIMKDSELYNDIILTVFYPSIKWKRIQTNDGRIFIAKTDEDCAKVFEIMIQMKTIGNGGSSRKILSDWESVLLLYLNGKGNLDIPIGDD